MTDIEFRAVDARVAAVHGRPYFPALIIRIEAELIEERGCGGDAGDATKKTGDYLPIDAETEDAARLRVILRGQIVVVREPRLQVGVADDQYAGIGAGRGIGRVVGLVLIDRRGGDHLGEIGLAVGPGIGRAHEEVGRGIVGQVQARVIAFEAAIGGLAELLARGIQVRERTGCAGVRLADAVALYVAHERAVGVALEGAVGVDERAGGLGVNPLVAHAREEQQPVVEESGLALRVEGGGDFLEVLRGVETGGFGRNLIRRRLGEEVRVPAPGLDHAVQRGLGDVVVGVEIIVPGGVDLHRVGGQCAVAVYAVVGVDERALAVRAVLRLELGADLDGRRRPERTESTLHQAVDSHRVVAVVAQDAVGRIVQYVIAEIVQIEGAVVGIEGRDLPRAGRRDVVVIDPHTGGVCEGGADSVEVALAGVPHPGLRGGGGAARFGGPAALGPAMAQVGAEGARVDVEKIAPVGCRAAAARRVGEGRPEGQRHAPGDGRRGGGAHARRAVHLAEDVEIIRRLQADREHGIGRDPPVGLQARGVAVIPFRPVEEVVGGEKRCRRSTAARIGGPGGLRDVLLVPRLRMQRGEHDAEVLR